MKINSTLLSLLYVFCGALLVISAPSNSTVPDDKCSEYTDCANCTKNECVFLQEGKNATCISNDTGRDHEHAIHSEDQCPNAELKANCSDYSDCLTCTKNVCVFVVPSGETGVKSCSANGTSDEFQAAYDTPQECPESKVNCSDYSDCLNCTKNGCVFVIPSGETGVKSCGTNGTTDEFQAAFNTPQECPGKEPPKLTTPPPTTSAPPATTTTEPATSTTEHNTTPPTTSVTTTQAPTTTTKTTSTSTTTTTAKSTEAPTEEPSTNRRFDGPSFIGGIVLCLGVMAIGFVAWKFYKARTERNYHTL